ncbi:hypothetical protein I5G58_gp066 [Mycobacterium phage BirdsNest]|uniref:Uncharacterized protein n=1 Tax=Mycobacterium phage BirdsNest TaxID=2686231 RepID=A0A6B9LCW3_9CAUD|nr:hypothetical protein I5G58_gp066 [Mycobacterium phage BirdsNest]QHB37368.1 hypothetical protein PBI_BIRDSNEST_66 [Mycobacterium phage BirdsNest]
MDWATFWHIALVILAWAIGKAAGRREVRRPVVWLNLVMEGEVIGRVRITDLTPTLDLPPTEEGDRG